MLLLTYSDSLFTRMFLSHSGHEADSARSLKEALGLSDEEAAPAHLEVAQKLYKQGFETKDRQTQFENRKVRLVQYRGWLAGLVSFKSALNSN